MQVNQVMQKDILTALPSASISEVAKLMAEKKIGSVLIAQEGGKLEGILTDRDIALAVAAEGKDPLSTRCSDIMTSSPQATEQNADLDAALDLMNRAHARRLPVVDHGRLVGVLSSADVAGAFKDRFNQFIGLEQTYVRS